MRVALVVLLSQLLDRLVDRVLRRERELVHVPRDRVLLGAALKRGAQGGAAVLGVDVGGGDLHGFLLQSLRGIFLRRRRRALSSAAGRPWGAGAQNHPCIGT